jgi:hypothetical protein
MQGNLFSGHPKFCAVPWTEIGLTATRFSPEPVRSAELWAAARKMGRQSADDASLDADTILVEQAGILVRDGDETVIATTNVRHLAWIAPLAV